MGLVGSRLVVALATTIACTAMAQPVSVRVIAIGDLHGHLQPPAGSGPIPDSSTPGATRRVAAGGIASLATAFSTLRQGAQNSIVVGVGDLIGASPIVSNLFADEPSVVALSRAGLELSAAGIHEFDRGYQELARLQTGQCAGSESCVQGIEFSGAKFRYLAANVFRRGSGERLMPAFVIREFGGVRVAFIGAGSRRTPLLVKREGIAGLEFRDEAESINAAVAELRKMAVSAFVVLLHEGAVTPVTDPQACPTLEGDLVDIARRLDPSVKVVLTGMTHRAYICDRDGRLLTNSGSFGRYATVIDLQLDRARGEIVGWKAENVLIDPERFPPDQELDGYVRRVAALAEQRVNREVATVEGTFTRNALSSGETSLGNLVADARVAAMRAATGAEVALVNRGGLRASLPPRASGGKVTLADLFTVQPFGNSLVTITLTGAELLRVLEQQWRAAPAQDDEKKRDHPARLPIRDLQHQIDAASRVLQVSGLRYTWDGTRPIGSRVLRDTITVNGAPLAPGRSYRVVVDDFLLAGGDGFTLLEEGRERIAGPRDLDALERYVSGRHLVAAPAEGRIRRLHRLNIELEERQVGPFISALVEAKAVEARPFVNATGGSTAALAAATLSWPPRAFTPELIGVLCRINPHICTQAKDGSAIWRNEAAPTGQAAASESPCTPASPPWVVCLPYVALTGSSAMRRISLEREKASLEEIVVDRLRGCVTYDEKCDAFIRYLNPPDRPDKSTFRIPIRVYEVGLLYEEVGTFEAIKNAATIAGLPNERLSVPATAVSHAAHTTPTFPSRDPLAVMSYPDQLAKPARKVMVGVLDKYMDDAHCLFQRGDQRAISLKRAAQREQGQSAPGDRTQVCGELRKFGDDIHDHAAFVASLIVSRSDKFPRMGANPEALIWALESGSSLASSGDPITEQGPQGGISDLRVINISQDFYKEDDQSVDLWLRKWIMGNDLDPGHEQILFVAAAGNHGRDIRTPTDCRVIPACWSRERQGRKNIISVVALDSSGEQVLQISNRGPFLDVAAVGQATGAVHGNYVASHEGTSFAAPYVSALASLIAAQVPVQSASLGPQGIKQRILFTSDFLDSLEGKVAFGRINFSRALDYGASTLQLSDGKHLRGYLEPGDDPLKVEEGFTPEGARFSGSIPMMQIKRIFATKNITEQSRYSIAYIDGERVLQKVRAARVAPMKFSFRIKDDVVPIDLGSLVDFTSCSFLKRCGEAEP